MKFRILVAAVAAVLVLVFLNARQPGVLGDDLRADAYTLNGAPMGSVLIAVPFAGTTDDDVRVQVAVDWNADDTVQESEWAVRNVTPLIRKNGINRFAMPMPQGSSIAGPLPVVVALTDGAVSAWADDTRESMTVSVPVTAHDLLSVWDIAAPGSSQELKRGIFVEAAHAQQEEVDVQREGDVGDISGGPMDCFPIAATNNIISLAEERGQRDKLPKNPADMVNELKQDMQFDNGVLTRNFVSGKQAFLARYGLPIVTEVIAKPTFQQIADALAEGGAVELSMAHVRSASGNADAGHVVTVVGAAAADGQMGVFAHDPATPEGADFLPLSAPPPPNTFWRMDYPLWDGVTVIDFLYVQKWVDEGTTGGATGVSMPEETVEIDVLLIGGKHYPFQQFRVAGPDRCESDHYHSDQSSVFAMDLTTIRDERRDGCGFGAVADVPRETVTMDQTEWDRIRASMDLP